MQIITICGNLSDDATVRTRKEDPSKEFISFKVIVNENSGAEKTTTTYDVIYSKTKVYEYLKKGQKVVITGDLSVSQREIDGKTYVNLQIRPYKLELAGQSKKN